MEDEKKTNIGVRINDRLWREFRIRNICDGTKMGELIEGWITKYLNSCLIQKPTTQKERKKTRFRGDG